MNDKEIKARFERWLSCATDSEVQSDLVAMQQEEKVLKESFYSDLAFGTGGLRGTIGTGTNKMNIYTVARATQGIANYIMKHFAPEQRSVAVSFDSRIKSDLFAKTASDVFCANGITVYRYGELMPTPCLSYAVRELGCCVGVMITASHNPSKYNGYKVYEKHGCQITTEMASEIEAEINALDFFSDVYTEKRDGIQKGIVHIIDDSLLDRFLDCVRSCSVLYGDEIDRNVSIVYSPLNGTGRVPVLRALRENGYEHITVVKEQEMPDGHFTTCPYPNPEIKEAMQLGMEYAEKNGSDLLLATDPDCDRIGIAEKTDKGYRLFTGNEVGLLLLDYICFQKTKHGKMPQNPVVVKTIVTTDLADKIADHYNVEIINVLTGFKFIGEQIGGLEEMGQEDRYLLGFEESYGYLSGTYVRDKDAVNAAFLICEMFAYYKTRGVSLLGKLNELYRTYGYCLNTLHSYEYEGMEGMSRMKTIMETLRSGKVLPEGTLSVTDYAKGVGTLPPADVLKYTLNVGSLVVRPSGTEPKIKIYFSVTAENEAQAIAIERDMTARLERDIFR